MGEGGGGAGCQNIQMYIADNLHVFCSYGDTFRYSGDKEVMREHYLKLAEEASEDKDVILYFDDSQLGLMRTMSGIHI